MFLEKCFSSFILDTGFIFYNMLSETANTTRIPRTFIENEDGTIRLYLYEYDLNMDKDLDVIKYIITNKADYYLENRKNKNVRFIPFYIIPSDSTDQIEENVNICELDKSVFFYPREIYDTLPNISHIKKKFDKIHIDFSKNYTVSFKKYKEIWEGNYIHPTLSKLPNDFVVRMDDEFGHRLPTLSYSNIWCNFSKSVRYDSLFSVCLMCYAYNNNIEKSNYFWVNNDTYMDTYMRDIADFMKVDVKEDGDLSSFVIDFNTMFDYDIMINKVAYESLMNLETDLFSKCNTKSELISKLYEL